ncbi:CBS domain-containing protein CBSX5-like [Arachis stenosperma]|uniref:CBS domain-containing protein CBSX5-like n=1 Tax=Arachis stenosperma TaxID=217475 RepID=UPI0025AD698C|nr:CBS domain-containing protein CBSX5-like [Arachis stenosperma]
MAVRLLSGHEVSDLCLGKPALRSLSITDTLADALSALKRIDDTFVSVWNCNHSLVRSHFPSPPPPQERCKAKEDDCRCVGRLCMLDIICYLCKPENLSAPAAALRSPISLLITDHSALVSHLEPNASLLDAIDAMHEGAQNLVIPIQSSISSRRKSVESLDSIFHNNNRSYCWVTQEDVIRYLLNAIAAFSPTPASPINTLNVIDDQNLFAVNYDDPASSALNLLLLSLIHQSSVAIVDPEGKFVGEISPFMLNSCDEAVAPALATLSAGDLMAYIDCGGPPEDLVQIVKERLEEQNLSAALELLGDEGGLSSWSSFCSSSSEDDASSGKNWKLGGYSARVVRRSEAIVCYPWSSLVAVMIQALSHRVSYVWVVEDDGTLTGIVTFEGMLKVFREHLKSMC